MLLRQDGCRHQDGDLLPVHDGAECDPQRNLGLAVSHVAAEEPVHWLLRLHVRHACVNGLLLVGSRFVWEGGREGAFPVRDGLELAPLRGGTHRLDAKQFRRQIPGGVFGLLLLASPDGRAKLRKLGLHLAAAYISADKPGLLEGDVEPRLVGELQLHRLYPLTIALHCVDAVESADAVVEVDGEGALLQLEELLAA